MSTRREVLGAGLAMAGAAALHLPSARAADWVRPGMPGWPNDAEWSGLKAAVGGRLSPVNPPDFNDAAVDQLLGDPFYLGDQPGLTENSGWLDAWRSVPSAYVVAAESTADVAAAIGFARAHKVRLVVRGGGHSYLGTSTAPEALMIWTRRMNAITVHDGFTPQGSSAAPIPAVSAGAGCIWLHLYQAVTGGSGRYVQGSGCTTFGVAGLVQGGGFGSFSKRYGLAAASLLEAEIVTADGMTRIVSAVQQPDLFWALKGGGGGTFGVVTRMTLATHDLPATFGSVRLDLQARSDDAYRRLLARFVDVYATNLFNPHWGELAIARPDNRLQISMVFEGLSKEDARAAWQPLLDFADANSADYQGQDGIVVAALPARKFWNADFHRRYVPQAVVFDSRPGASPKDFCWGGDADQAGAFWYAYTSVWLPASLLKQQNQARLVDAWFAASRNWGLALVFNKALAGAPAAAIEAARNTALNPDVVDAFAWAVTSARGPPAFPGMPAPNLATRTRQFMADLLGASAGALRSRVGKAMATMRAIAPGAGTYLNECDYFQPDWQKAFWGTNYPRLAAIKRRCDPDGLFTVHHGVGSEPWGPDGFTK
jgi:FAD/FMN-containing dehydrogenase